VKSSTASSWLTGFAAAGSVVCVFLAALTAPAESARLAAKCDPHNGVGSAWQITYKGAINARSLDLAVLNPGDELTTDDSGSVDFCLTLAGTDCRIASSSAVKVAPTEGVLFSVTEAKGVSCHSTIGKLVRVKVGKATIEFRPPSPKRKPSQVGQAAPGLAVYSIKFNDGLVNYVCKCRPGGVTDSSVGKDGKTATVRSLWGDAKGAFRTKGRYSEATVRG
jgi:hypothetical protein